MEPLLTRPDKLVFIAIVVLAMTQVIAHCGIRAMVKGGGSFSLSQKVFHHVLTFFDWPIAVFFTTPAMLLNEETRVRCGKELYRLFGTWLLALFVCALPYTNGSFEALGNNVLAGLGISLVWFIPAYVVNTVVQGIKDGTLLEMD